MDETYVNVKDLPAFVQECLKEVKYGKHTISIQVSEKYSPQICGGDGKKGFCIALDLVKRTKIRKDGSWGGANVFNPQNAVDLDSSEYPIPDNCLVIKGMIGHPRTFAWILTNQNTLCPLLPEKTEMDEKTQLALDILCGLKGGKYRKDSFWRHRIGEYSPNNPLIQTLSDLGLIQVRSNGAIVVTTKGMNSRKNRVNY